MCMYMQVHIYEYVKEQEAVLSYHQLGPRMELRWSAWQQALYPQAISLVLFDCSECCNLIQLAVQSPADVYVQCCGQRICSTTVRSVSKLRQEFSECEASLGCMMKVRLKTDLRVKPKQTSRK